MPIQIERVDQLIGNFDACLRGFDQYSAIGGQPAESHTRTLSFVRQGAHPTAVLDISEWYASGHLGHSMHTSVPKMIDNASIGYRHLHDHGDAVAPF